MVTLEHEVPLLCRTRHVEGSKPHLVGFMRALRLEELLALVQPSERIVSAFEHGERQLVVSWHGGTFVVLVMGCIVERRRCLERQWRRRVWEGNGLNR
jgi:hypothetical protein